MAALSEVDRMLLKMNESDTAVIVIVNGVRQDDLGGLCTSTKPAWWCRWWIYFHQLVTRTSNNRKQRDRWICYFGMGSFSLQRVSAWVLDFMRSAFWSQLSHIEANVNLHSQYIENRSSCSWSSMRNFCCETCGWCLGLFDFSTILSCGENRVKNLSTQK